MVNNIVLLLVCIGSFFNSAHQGQEVTLQCIVSDKVSFQDPPQKEEPQILGPMSGTWKGILTQDAGGVRPVYQLTLRLIQKGAVVTGEAEVVFDGKKAVMALQGAVFNGTNLRIYETEIINSDDISIDRLQWCLKWFDLDYMSGEDDSHHLQGTWKGRSASGPCVPGNIDVSKEITRA